MPAEPAMPGGTATPNTTAIRVITYLTDPAARELDPVGPASGLAAAAPVLDLGRSWIVSGHREVSALAKDPALTVDVRRAGDEVVITSLPELDRVLGLMMNLRDGDDHRRLRRLVNGAFSARRIAAVDDQVRRVVDEILDRVTPAGTLEVISDLGSPLPVLIACEMIGVPEADRDAVVGWSTLLAAQLGQRTRDAAEVAAAAQALAELTAYVGAMIADRRQHPGDDLVSLLVAAQDNDGMTPDELVAFVILLCLNGLETLTNALGNAVRTVLDQPGLLAALTDPDAAAAAFEETMRLMPPVRMGARTAVAQVRIAGHVIAEGSMVALYWAAANRDPDLYPDPDSFRLDRGPVRSFGFGHGPHHCLGAPLSILAGRAVLSRLAVRFPHLEADSASSLWRRDIAFCGVRRLGLVLAPGIGTAIIDPKTAVSQVA